MSNPQVIVDILLEQANDLARIALNSLKNDPEFLAKWESLGFEEKHLEYDTIRGIVMQKLLGEKN